MSDGGNNYEIFRECVSGAIVQKSQGTRKKRKLKGKKRGDTTAKDSNDEGSSFGLEKQDPEELADFIDFIASEVFHALPQTLQTLSYSKIQNDDSLAKQYGNGTELSDADMETLTAPIPVSVSESLSVYGILPESMDITAAFLRPVLTDYITSVTAAPPAWATTKTEACEICERDWIPLSYHHLIPREVHAKALKRGWHEEFMLNSVAWLCRACHSFVHKMATNEELAREYYTIDRITERYDVQDWAKWVGRVRWKAR
ncbi:hypothetical protein TMatcc_003945 [Talaromyces marneffei ATCC 18224]|uniref:HNH domain-containing protein n=2 Tax=Talaromyces marneffei TaxID=37727 RepID=B6Q7K6_TALMQ|nr:uncharacterized protein EYB26_001069 [Talaromyces marneffei]EEA27758.1 conserved hypothetical protein [Talaromyces marneffei ATCC 18224]KAE8556566.1 hypothetical protein EYB25_001267 [Talaromyces marneffei]QGA13419.1 hypothetical protein EYB26_001069 [Talaromyces marneffei]